MIMMKTLDPREAAANWPERERQWRIALGRIKLGVEPVADQLEKYRLVTWTLSFVAGGMGTILFALFCAFRHPFIGLAVAGGLFGPVIVSAWIGFARLESLASRYLREREEVDRLLREDRNAKNSTWREDV